MSGAQDLLLGNFAAAGGGGGYQISRSLRFNSADSAYLNRTPASAGNRKTWTWSGWVKRSSLGALQQLFEAKSSGTAYTAIYFTSGDVLSFDDYDSSQQGLLNTTAVYRDVSAWYHIVMSCDTTQATSTNRLKLYVNGAQVTAFSSSTYPSQNRDTFVDNTNEHRIGGGQAAGQFFNGYMTEINFVDGQALTPSSFGETDAITGVWKPKAYTGTYGTNGFYLPFSDNASTTTLGDDFSGNNNDWTTNNFSVTAGTGNDSLVDTPTPYGTDTGAGGEVRGNYATLNPLLVSSTYVTIANGNLSSSSIQGTATYQEIPATFAVDFSGSGKWYAEVNVTTVASTYYPSIGISPSTKNFLAKDVQGGDSSNSTAYMANGQKYNNASLTAYGSSYTGGDTIGIAVDEAAGTVVMYKNNVSQGTLASSLTGLQYITITTTNSSAFSVNFGQRPFAYTAPSGFKALCTQNLSTPTVVQGDDYFNTVLWTGDGTGGRTITGVGFEPDLVWVKTRNQALKHQLTDIVRGVGKSLCSNDTAAEVSNDAEGYVSAFNSDGFVTSSGSTSNERYNASGYTYVAWNWNGGGTGVSNTQGTITSTVSANTTAGISVVTFTGNGTSDASVGHGLGAVPSMMILKSRSQSGENWHSYWSVLGQTKDLQLNTNDSAFTYTSPNIWGSTAWSSTLFRLGSQSGVNNNGSTYVAYVFAPIAGFSAFGSYTGNGSTDGPFIYTGFEPAFVMFKCSSTSGREWIMQDIKRQTYNAAPNNAYNLAANLSSAENDPTDLGGPSNANNIDWLSNGFKIRYSNANCNASGATYIYMAFAENPFKYALAR